MTEDMTGPPGDVLRIDRFDDVEHIGAAVRDRVAVIFELPDDGALARRVIDFASGVSYAVDASLERIDTRTYLLRPPD